MTENYCASNLAVTVPLMGKGGLSNFKVATAFFRAVLESLHEAIPPPPQPYFITPSASTLSPLDTR
jgi:hypothetical protein